MEGNPHLETFKHREKEILKQPEEKRLQKDDWERVDRLVNSNN